MDDNELYCWESLVCESDILEEYFTDMWLD